MNQFDGLSNTLHQLAKRLKKSDDINDVIYVYGILSINLSQFQKLIMDVIEQEIKK